MAESVRDYMKHEDAMHACENREEREYEKTGVTDTGEQSGSIKNCCDLRSRRSNTGCFPVKLTTVYDNTTDTCSMSANELSCRMDNDICTML